MTQQKKILIVLGLMIVVGLGLYLVKRSKEPPVNNLVSEEARRKGPCPGAVKAIESEGKKYRITENWYACKAQEAGDLVYYRYSFSLPPVVRKVVAVPGDIISLKKDEANKAYNLIVNHKVVEDSDGKPHHFGIITKEPVLSLYIKGGEDKLKPQQSVVFADQSPSVLDSGMFGVVNSDDFLGKAELEK
jgi:hypothetical protein